MILQSLVSYYDCLVEKGLVSPPGWSDVNVSYALQIDESGSLEHVVSLKNQSTNKLKPQRRRVPEQVKGRTGSSIKPNFLCDNAQYLLGLAKPVKNNSAKDSSDKIKNNEERAKKCFSAAADYHKKMLKGLSCVEANAVCRFFDNWDVSVAGDSSVLANEKEELAKGGNIVFLCNGRFLQDIPQIKERWEEKRQINTDKENVLCIITGKTDKLALLHPSMKGIKKAQSSGASLVSFNEEAYCSFAKEQGTNAQTGEHAAFAYGAALNYLISCSSKQYLGDTIVLTYAINGDDNYRWAFNAFMYGAQEDDCYSEEDLSYMVNELCKGRQVQFNENYLDPNMDFYILGIAPNNARLSIRFFWHNTFGTFVKNINSHQKRLKIEGVSLKNKASIPSWRILMETYREGREASPILAGNLVRSIVQDIHYPTTLINTIDMRIRADHKINDVRAAIIKAYYIKNKNEHVPEEVLSMALNKESNNTAYNLGRLFAVLEKIQQAANPGINATIRDKFFGSASSTPASVFPNLLNLSVKHLRKIDGGLKIYYEKLKQEIMDKLDSFPTILNMPERGAFQLGYYHQVQNLYRGNNEEGDN